MQPRGPQTTGIKVQRVELDQDYKAPDGYVLQELTSSKTQDGEVQFFAILGILLTPAEEAEAAKQQEAMMAEMRAEEERRQKAAAAGKTETDAPTPSTTQNTPPQA